MHNGRKLKMHRIFLHFRGRPVASLFVLLGTAILMSGLFILRGLQPQSRKEGQLAIDPEIAAMDRDALSGQISVAKKKLRQLSKRNDRLFPKGPAILIDSAANQIYLVQGTKIVIQDKCSTGTGFELTDEIGKRTWTFDTPRGYFKVLGKVENPIWYRPDWAFIEEGESIPKSRSERAVANVLGEYAIAFGNGYYIHGTLYTRTLGTSVTHGCIRVGDDTLKKIYSAVQPGTPIWIY
jgi:L,D-transpeptidase ErfK/SrfK